ncbi:MAG: hypothetical protein HC802_18710 [Caldilineaceae bacterium]|nr:hypothetical protein [Caldilineaceae bacterium]
MLSQLEQLPLPYAQLHAGLLPHRQRIQCAVGERQSHHMIAGFDRLLLAELGDGQFAGQQLPAQPLVIRSLA